MDADVTLEGIAEAPWGVLMIVGSIGIGGFGVVAILGERRRHLALRTR